MDFSLDFPLGREYLLGNTAVLLRTTLITTIGEFTKKYATMSDEPVRDSNGYVEDCPLCPDCLDPKRSVGHWTEDGSPFDAWTLRNTKCNHVYHFGCFFNMIHFRQSCPMCQISFYNTPEEIFRAEAVMEALDRTAAGEYDTTAGLTELPIAIHGRSLAACCLIAAHHLRIMGIGGPSPEDEQQYALNGVADHVDGRRIIECLLHAIGKRHGRMCRIQDFSEQLPSRAATILRRDHPTVVYSHAMWRFVSDAASLGLISYARTFGEWSKD